MVSRGRHNRSSPTHPWRHGAVSAMSKRGLSFLVFPEGKHWVAQCIEHNIAVQARDRQGIIPEIRRSLWGAIAIRAHKELPGIDSLPPAADRYRRAFDAAGEPEVLEPSPWRLRGLMMPPVTLRYSRVPPN